MLQVKEAAKVYLGSWIYANRNLNDRGDIAVSIGKKQLYKIVPELGITFDLVLMQLM